MVSASRAGPPAARLLHALGAQTAQVARSRGGVHGFESKSSQGYDTANRGMCRIARGYLEKCSSLRRPTGLARWAAILRSKRMVTLWVVILL